jgi:four helix bundle protein
LLVSESAARSVGGVCFPPRGEIFSENGEDMQESPIFTRTFDMLVWLIPMTLKFPREQRFIMAQRVQQAGLNFYEAITAASMSNNSRRHLEQADIELQRLRLHLRLCQRMEFLSLGQYEHIAKMVAEIGKLLGGWYKKERGV